ncbi:MAG: glutaredoxin family protein [Gammaproteobacteria bacterium]|nr:glutaredoxin family protein [Gammaproteobacteria bacterium]
MSRRLSWLLLAALILAPTAYAQKLYKWVDKNGNVSYHDQLPPSDSDYRVEEKLIAGQSKPPIKSDASEKFPVVLYVAPKCESCNNARTYLKQRGVPFTEKNVEGDRKLQDEMIKQTGGLSVPTVTVGEKVMRGYMESLLEGELDQAGYPKAETKPEESAQTPAQP